MKDEMKKENPAAEKSFSFALRIIELFQHLTGKEKEFVLSKQILRSGTGIGANLEENLAAQSPADFQTKISIAYKKALETSYWLKLLQTSGYIADGQFQSIHADCQELIKILGAAQLTMRNKIQKGNRP